MAAHCGFDQKLDRRICGVSTATGQWPYWGLLGKVG